MLPVYKNSLKLIFLFLVSGSKFSRFAGNQGDAISRGFGQNFLPQCVRHSLARLLASLVFALLVLLLGGGITFAAAGRGAAALLLMLRLLLVLVGESKQRGSFTTVTFTLSSLCEQFSLGTLLFQKL